MIPQTSSAPARAGGCLRLIRYVNPPHAPRRIWFISRSVRLAVAHGGDDYAFVPSVAPSNRTERIFNLISTHARKIFANQNVLIAFSVADFLIYSTNS
jgi:hypothetical protein